MPSTSFLVFASIGAGALVYAVRSFTNQETPTKTNEEPLHLTKLEEQRITLKGLSFVWAKGQMQKIPITDLVGIWKHPGDESSPEAAIIEPSFTKPEMAAFYINTVKGKPFFTNKQLQVIIDLLAILDKDGECESVVNKHPQESEKTLSADTYNLLRQVPLWRHSLNVSTEIIRLTPRGASTPKMVIAALAHDLGKIPSYYDPMATSAVHGFISAQTLEWLDNLKTLRYSDEVIEAVRFHHSPPDGSYLAKALQDADAAARRYEIMYITNSGSLPPVEDSLPTGQGDTTQESTTTLITTGKSAPPVNPDLTLMPKNTTPTDVTGMPTAPPKKTPLGTPASPKIKGSIIPIEWFDPAKLKNALAAQVNKPLPGERFWAGISMPEGFCYFKINAFWACINKAFPGEPAVTSADAQSQSNIMLSISQSLLSAEDIPKIVRKDQIGAMYIMNPDSEKPTDLYLVPIKTTCLGLDVQACEINKPKPYLSVKCLKPKFARPNF